MKKIKKLLKHIKKLPLAAQISLAAISGIFVACLITYLVPKTIEFSYTGSNCVSQLLVAPNAQSQKGDSQFSLEPQRVVSLGPVVLFSTKVCAVPTQSPTAARHGASLGLLGGWFGAKQFRISVPEAPKPIVANIIDTKISAVRPLKIDLTSGDSVHQYSLVAGDKKTTCKDDEATLTCDTAALGLIPDKDYTLELYKAYGDDAPQKVATAPVKTLTPVVLSGTTLGEGQTVYDMPTSFTFTFDRPLESGTVILESQQGDTKTPLSAVVKTDAKTATVTVAEALPRNASLTLTLTQIEATDGASLGEPVVRHFTTSGGPKVAGVSIGATGVAQNAQVTITFDQPINESVDVKKFARATGVNGVVTKKSPTEITISIQSAPLCAAFSLVVDKGIASGVNNELSQEAWKFDARTVCGTSSIIGYSVKGRAITASYFGNGATTILFTGGIHGTEPSGVTTMQAWVTYLQTNGYKIPADKRVVIVPNTNPDGIASNKRYNANDVNIDRNFPAANWSSSIDTDTGILPMGGGSSAGSEPETKALLTLNRQLRPRLEVSFHAQGRLVGANDAADAVAIGNIYSKTVGYATMFGQAEAVMGHSITGEYEDWMGQELGIPAILIELPSLSGNYFNSQLPALWKILAI